MEAVPVFRGAAFPSSRGQLPASLCGEGRGVCSLAVTLATTLTLRPGHCSPGGTDGGGVTARALPNTWPRSH